MSKHPVSELQEKMAKHKKALPQYTLQQVENFFVSTVKVNGITAIGTGISKASAKCDAANRAINKLGDDEPQAPSTNLTTISNYIGALNDLTSKHKLPPPFYFEGTYNMSSGFIVECKLLSYCTKGCASNKKQAKQLAAKNMLIGLNAGLKDLLKQRANIESITEQRATEPQNKTNLFSEASSSNDEEMSTVYMWNELLKYVTVSTVQVLQMYPEYILSLSFDGDAECKTTIMEVGKTYQETHYNLLKKALTLVKRMQ